MMHTMRRIAVGATAVAITSLISPAVAVAAPTSPGKPADTTTVRGMQVIGYDSAVAEANGYEIVTDSTGHQSSVPVTPEAQTRDAQKTAPLSFVKKNGFGNGVTPNELEYDEVNGDCGLSYVGAEKGANDRVSYETGYVVNDAVAFYSWRVIASGFLSSETAKFSGGLSDAEFSASGTLTAKGFGTTFVPGVSSAAAATLVDGSICYSGGPSVRIP